MKNFYFTFGQNHCTEQGLALKNYYITVIAEDYGTAREIFTQDFTSKYMAHPLKFSMQYTEEEWDKNNLAAYFPGGEYIKIYQP